MHILITEDTGNILTYCPNFRSFTSEIKALADVPSDNSGRGKRKKKHTLKYHSWEVSSSTCLCQTRSPQLGISEKKGKLK